MTGNEPEHDPMPTCQEVAAMASDHLDGALPLRRSLAMNAHLALCPNCRRYLRQLRDALRLARAAVAAEPAPDPEAEAALLALFERTRKA